MNKTQKNSQLHFENQLKGVTIKDLKRMNLAMAFHNMTRRMKFYATMADDVSGERWDYGNANHNDIIEDILESKGVYMF